MVSPVVSPRTARTALYATAAAALCAVLSLSGCGYTTGSLHTKGGGAIAVPIFANRTYHQGVDTELTEAVIKELQRRTGAHISGEASGVSQLTGTVLVVQLRELGSGAASGLPDDMEIELTVEVAWTDARGHELLAPTQLRTAGGFVPGLGASEPIETGRRGAIDAMARKIVDAMRSEW